MFVMYEFVEGPAFNIMRDLYFPSDADFCAFQTSLMRGPDAGRVMRGCGGLRKVRWPDPRRGKGKRGGLRIIYLHDREAIALFLVYVYDKNKADDLTPEQRADLKRIAEEYRKEQQDG